MAVLKIVFGAGLFIFDVAGGVEFRVVVVHRGCLLGFVESLNLIAVVYFQPLRFTFQAPLVCVPLALLNFCLLLAFR